MTNFNVIFDNGGGVTLQTEGWNHNYTDAKQAGCDVKALLTGEDPADWDGNEPEAAEMTCTAEDIRNGGARQMDDSEVAEIVAGGTLDNCWGYNMADFFTALGVVITDDNYNFSDEEEGQRWAAL